MPQNRIQNLYSKDVQSLYLCFKIMHLQRRAIFMTNGFEEMHIFIEQFVDSAEK